MTFSPDYATARERVRSAADRLGWGRQSFPIGVLSPKGEELTIDVLESSRGNTDRLLLVSSGLHGVEGFFGSAIQLALLERWQRESRLPPNVRVLFLHGLNPYGFAWSRRVDSENIDPNRNFLLDDEQFRGSPEG